MLLVRDAGGGGGGGEINMAVCQAESPRAGVRAAEVQRAASAKHIIRNQRLTKALRTGDAEPAQQGPHFGN